MTPEQMRIAIAEACGLRRIVEVPFIPASVDLRNSWFTDAARAEWVKTYPRGGIPMSIPDYLNDLNAMHEAEKVLSYEQQDEFIRVLHKIAYAGYGNWGAIHAAAAQRAEAFLRTIGRWIETKEGV